jgi:hypothetical protein
MDGLDLPGQLDVVPASQRSWSASEWFDTMKGPADVMLVPN